ncbi:MAG: tetratricopeptide repeat protein, partial [Cytophagaceae bacterium]
YSKAIETDKEFGTAYFNRADTYLTLGNAQSALTDLLTIQKTYQDSTFYQSRLGEAYAGLNNVPMAQAAFDKALLLDANNVEALTNRAALSFSQKQYDDARSDIDKALTINPNQAEALNNKSLLLAREKQYAEALVAVDKALSQKANQPFYLNNKGYLLLMLNRDAEALPLLNQSIRLNDQNAWAHRNLGIYWLRQKKADQALTALKRSEQLDPSVDNLYAYLGQSLKLAGNDAAACDAWNRGKLAGDEEAIVLLGTYCR